MHDSRYIKLGVSWTKQDEPVTVATSCLPASLSQMHKRPPGFWQFPLASPDQRGVVVPPGACVQELHQLSSGPIAVPTPCMSLLHVCGNTFLKINQFPICAHHLRWLIGLKSITSFLYNAWKKHLFLRTKSQLKKKNYNENLIFSVVCNFLY